MTRKATKTETEIAADEALTHSLITGEVLRAKDLCPLVVVRTYGAGVHVGYLARIVGQEAELLECRRLWQWFGANTLNEVASEGVSGNVRLSKPLRQQALTSVIEVLPVSDAAKASLTESRWAR